MFSYSYIINLNIKTFLTNSWIKEKKIKAEIANYLQGSKNENALTKNLWNMAEAIFR